MKCPHCGQDITEKLIISEAAKIQRRKAKKKLTSEEARKIARARWDKEINKQPLAIKPDEAQTVSRGKDRKANLKGDIE